VQTEALTFGQKGDNASPRFGIVVAAQKVILLQIDVNDP
jgi:hypothetical protein